LPFEEARVIEIREIKTPLHRNDAKSSDYLLILGLDSEHVAKILHVKPRVKIGERLAYGDPIGETIISGYLFPWSEPHMHLEVRHIEDRYRARGGLKLAVAAHRTVPAQSIRAVRGVVTEVHDHYVLLKGPGSIRGPTQIAVEFGNATAYLEGGYPHYGYAAVLTCDSGCRAYIVERNDSVDLPGFGGISTYIGREEIKLVFRDKVSWMKEGDLLELEDLSGMIYLNSAFDKKES